jgi:hypothetical protein
MWCNPDAHFYSFGDKDIHAFPHANTYANSHPDL